MCAPVLCLSTLYTSRDDELRELFCGVMLQLHGGHVVVTVTPDKLWFVVDVAVEIYIDVMDSVVVIALEIDDTVEELGNVMDPVVVVVLQGDVTAKQEKN